MTDEVEQEAAGDAAFTGKMDGSDDGHAAEGEGREDASQERKRRRCENKDRSSGGMTSRGG